MPDVPATQDLPEAQDLPAERWRIHGPGRRIDNGSDHMLIFANEWNGDWTVYEPDGPGVRLTRDRMVTAAELILWHAARGSTR